MVTSFPAYRSGGFLLEELHAETAAQAAKQEERLPELQEFYESCEQALLGHRSVWKQQLHSLKLRRGDKFVKRGHGPCRFLFHRHSWLQRCKYICRAA